MQLPDSWWKDSEREISRLLWETYFADLFAVGEVRAPRINSLSALLDAIRSGRVVYEAGRFTGSFSAAISRELSAFAQFDKRAKTWTGTAPAEVQAAAAVASSRRQALVRRMERSIADAESRLEETIQTLSFDTDLPLRAADRQVRRELQEIGVPAELGQEQLDYLRREYTESQRYNIRNWDPEQIVRLREAVQRFQLSGGGVPLRDFLLAEWEVSANKARFLARQETSLLISKLGLSRAGEVGVKRYTWLTSRDERVREDHKRLHGLVVDLESPPVVDRRTGRRAHAGEDFNCRCAKRWLLD